MKRIIELFESTSLNIYLAYLTFFSFLLLSTTSLDLSSLRAIGFTAIALAVGYLLSRRTVTPFTLAEQLEGNSRPVLNSGKIVAYTLLAGLVAGTAAIAVAVWIQKGDLAYNGEGMRITWFLFAIQLWEAFSATAINQMLFLTVLIQIFKRLGMRERAPLPAYSLVWLGAMATASLFPSLWTLSTREFIILGIRFAVAETAFSMLFLRAGFEAALLARFIGTLIHGYGYQLLASFVHASG